MSTPHTSRHIRTRSGEPDPRRIQPPTPQPNRATSVRQPSRQQLSVFPPPGQHRSRADSYYHTPDRTQRPDPNYELTDNIISLSPGGTNPNRQLYSTSSNITRQYSIQTQSSSSYYSDSMPTRTNSTATSTSNYDENIYPFSPPDKFDCVISIYQYSMDRKVLKGSAQVELETVRRCFKALPLGSIGTRRDPNSRRIVSLFEIVIHDPVSADSFVSLLGLVHGFLDIPRTSDLNYFYGLAVASYIFRCNKDWIASEQSWKSVRRALETNENMKGTALKWIVLAVAFGWDDLLEEMSREVILTTKDDSKLEGLRFFLTGGHSNLKDALLERRSALRDEVRIALSEKSEEINIKWNREKHPSVHALVYQLLIGQVSGNGALSPQQAHRTSPKESIDAFVRIVRNQLNMAIQVSRVPTAQDHRTSPSIRSGSSEDHTASGSGSTSNRNRNARSGATSRIIKDFLNTVELRPSKSKRVPTPNTESRPEPPRFNRSADMKALELVCKDLIAMFEKLEREVHGLIADDIKLPYAPEASIDLPQDRGIHELEGSFVPLALVSEKPLPPTPDHLRISTRRPTHERADSDTVPAADRPPTSTTSYYPRSPLTPRHERSTSETIQRANPPTPGLARLYDDCIHSPERNPTIRVRASSDAAARQRPKLYMPMQPLFTSPTDEDDPNTANTLRPPNDYLHPQPINPDYEYTHSQSNRASSQSCITDASIITDSHPTPRVPPRRQVPAPLNIRHSSRPRPEVPKREIELRPRDHSTEGRGYSGGGRDAPSSRGYGAGVKATTRESMLMDARHEGEAGHGGHGRQLGSWLELSPEGTPEGEGAQGGGGRRGR